ncbi:MAG: hypothetical protein ABI759_31805 [Candidatus Solibacter sp.]
MRNLILCLALILFSYSGIITWDVALVPPASRDQIRVVVTGRLADFALRADVAYDFGSRHTAGMDSTGLTNSASTAPGTLTPQGQLVYQSESGAFHLTIELIQSRGQIALRVPTPPRA